MQKSRLTANASWNSKTSMSFNVKPVLSKILEVEYVGLERVKRKLRGLVS